MRQHVNPLSRFFQLPLSLPETSELFIKPTAPIHLDIGSARGKFLIELASVKSNWNYLGLEIRHSLVTSSDKERTLLGLDNLRFLFCNVNVSLEDWLTRLPKGHLQTVSIQFPDPWFKRRHQKRRVLTPDLLISLSNALMPGGRIFLQSDLLSVIEPMVKLVQISDCYQQHEEFGSQWLLSNPFGVATEREKFVLEQGNLVYRAMFIRNNKSTPRLSDLENNYFTGII